MLSWIATFFSLLGVTLNAKKLRISWLVWIVANILWAIVGYRTHNTALAALQTIYVGFGIYGWHQWKPKPKPESRLIYVQETDFTGTRAIPPTGRNRDDFIAFLESASAEIKKWPKEKQEVAARIAAGWKSEQ